MTVALSPLQGHQADRPGGPGLRPRQTPIADALLFREIEAVPEIEALAPVAPAF
ncbi:MAG TPA: hypothetical protein VKP64_08250 [Mycobacteriales bacterium]|nr:hypothetical protein [Mycobacteriales bacterium]